LCGQFRRDVAPHLLLGAQHRGERPPDLLGLTGTPSGRDVGQAHGRQTHVVPVQGHRSDLHQVLLAVCRLP
jgi:hypothetical protein